MVCMAQFRSMTQSAVTVGGPRIAARTQVLVDGPHITYASIMPYWIIPALLYTVSLVDDWHKLGGYHLIPLCWGKGAEIHIVTLCCHQLYFPL